MEESHLRILVSYLKDNIGKHTAEALRAITVSGKLVGMQKCNNGSVVSNYILKKQKKLESGTFEPVKALQDVPAELMDAFDRCWKAIERFIAKPSQENFGIMSREWMTWLRRGGKYSFHNTRIIHLLCHAGHVNAACQMNEECREVFSARVSSQMKCVMQSYLVEIGDDDRAMTLVPYKDWYRQDYEIYEHLLCAGHIERAFRWLMNYIQDNDEVIGVLDLECAGLLLSSFSEEPQHKKKAKACREAFLKQMPGTDLSFEFLMEALVAINDSWNAFFSKTNRYEEELETTPLYDILILHCQKISESVLP